MKTSLDVFILSLDEVCSNFHCTGCALNSISKGPSLTKKVNIMMFIEGLTFESGEFECFHCLMTKDRDQ